MKLSAYQEKIKNWLYRCFDEELCESKVERNHRFLEEAFELVQSNGISYDECLNLLNYVYGRPAGEPLQEIGGVTTTLAALCASYGFSLEDAALTELDRIEAKVDLIREKQKRKPNFKKENYENCNQR